MKPNTVPFRALCAALALSVAASGLLGGCASAAAQEPAQASAAVQPQEPEQEKPENLIGTRKSETVYVSLDPSGRAYDTVVTDWLHSDTPGVSFEDLSDLEDIENIKGEQSPSRRGQRLSWRMEGSDLYYTGRTGKELPLEVKITYRLDGKEYDPQELAGKSGRLEIRLSFQNTSKHEVEVGGKKTVMYTPLMVAAGMALPDDTFGNVKVSDGTVVTDGSSQVAAVVCLPGLDDSLALSGYGIEELSGLDFPEEFTITADAVNFEMGPIMIAASPELPDLDDLKKSDEFDDMKQDLCDLRDMQNDLETLDPDRDIRSLLTDPARTEAAKTIIDDVFDFYDLNKDLLDILPKYVTDENVRLYDRIDHDLSEKAMGTLLDDDELAEIFDLVDDLSPNRLQELADDYDKLQKDKELLDVLKQMAGVAGSEKSKKLIVSLQTVYAAIQRNKAENPRYEADIAQLKGLLQYMILTQSAPTAGDARDAALRQQARRVLVNAINSEGGADRLETVLRGSRLNPTLQSELVSASAGGRIVDPNRVKRIKHTDGEKPPAEEPAASEPVSSEPVDSEPELGAPDASEPAPSAPAESAPAVEEPAESEPVPGTTAESGPEAVKPADGASFSEAVLAAAIDSDGNPLDAGEPEEPAGDPPAGATGTDGSGSGGGEGGRPGGEKEEPPAGEDGAGGGTDTAGTREPPEKPEKEDRPDAYLEITETTAGYYLLTGAIDEYLEKCGDEELREIADSAPQSRAARGGAAPVPPTSDQIAGVVTSLIGELGAQNILDLINCMEASDGEFSALLGALQASDPELYLEMETYLDKTLGDLAENADDMETLVLLLKKLDESNLLDEVENIDDLREDLSAARPVVKALRRDLDRADIHKSLHESPDTITTLLRMRDDLDAHRDVTETMRSLLQDEKVSLSRGMVATLDRLKGKGAADDAVEKLDDLDELLERKDRYVDLSKAYGIFSAAPEGLDTDVKFVMKTDEVKIPEPAGETAAPIEEKRGFFGWLKGLFT